MARKATYIEDKDFRLLVPFVVKAMKPDDSKPDEMMAEPEVITIEGYANFAGDLEKEGACCIDRANEVVVPSGMDIANYKKNPVILLNHDRTCPIGKATAVLKKPDGIFITAEIHEGAMCPEDFYAIKNGIIKSFSIGFRTKAGEYKAVNDKDVFFITKSELFETSCVTIPCNTSSNFTVIKSFGEDGFYGIAPNPTHQVAETKTMKGDDTMKLALKELLTSEQVEHFKSLGLEAELEELKEVSTKSFIESLFAKQTEQIKSDLITYFDEKFKTLVEAKATETDEQKEEGQPTSDETQVEEEETKTDEGEVEEKEETQDEAAESFAALQEEMNKLKALFAE